MSDRILFLDIDGVILPTRMWAAAQNIVHLEAEPIRRAPQLTFDPGSTGLLVQIARLSGATFVLHSNWRREWPGDPAALLEQLIRSGLGREHWHASWSVPVLEGRDKAREISAWLGEHGSRVRQCLILDDQPIEALVASASVETAQIRPLRDDGVGMREYRAALRFFGVTDPRASKEPAAPLWPVSVRAVPS